MTVFFFRKLSRFFYRKPFWGIGLYLLLLMPAFFLKPLVININTLDFVDSKSKRVESFRHHLEQFSSDQELFLIVSPKGGQAWSAADLCQLKGAIERVIPKLDNLVHFYSPFQIREVETSPHHVFFPTLIPHNCHESPVWWAKVKGASNSQIFFDKDFTSVILIFGFEDLKKVTTYGRFDPEHTSRIQKTLSDNLSSWNLGFTGNLIFQQAMKEGMDATQKLNILFIVALMLLARLLFNTWKSGFLMLGCLSAAFIPLQLAMTASGVPIDPLTTGLFLVLSLAVIEDFVAISTYQVEKGRRGFHAIARFSAASFFTTLTTVIGFGSLLVSDLSAVRRFGFWTAWGALLEWIVIFVFLPSILRLFPSLQYWTKPSSLSEIFKKMSIRLLPKSLAMGILLIMTLSPFALKKMNLNHSPFDILPEQHSFSQVTEKLKQIRGAQSDLQVVFKRAINVSDKKKILDEIKILPGVVQVETIDDHLPRSEGSELLNDLIQRESRLTLLGQKFISADRQERIFVLLASGDVLKINSLTEKLEQICNSHCAVQGEMVVFAEYTRLLINTLAESFVLSLLLVAGVIFGLLVINRQRPIWLYLATAMWAPCVMMILMALFQFPINMMTAVVGAIVVGLAGDNTIQFIMNRANRKNQDRAGQLSLMAFSVSIFMMGLSALFFFSYFLTMRELGLFLILGFLAALVGDLYLLRALKLKS